MQLQKQRVELEGKREDQSQKRQDDEILARTNQVATRADAKLEADVYLNATAAV